MYYNAKGVSILVCNHQIRNLLPALNSACSPAGMLWL